MRASACVRRESGLVQVSCNSVGEMRYGPADTRDDRARHRLPRSSCPAAPLRSSFGTSIDARRPSNGPPRQRPFGRPLQAVAVEHVGHNSLQRISYGMGFLQSRSVNSQCETRHRGGRGFDLLLRRRRRRISPLRFFCANWPLRACASPSPCYIHLRLARHFPAVRSGWPSPLHRRKCSGLSSCPTPVAWPSLRMAACVHVVPLGAIDEFCGDLVERVPG